MIGAPQRYGLALPFKKSIGAGRMINSKLNKEQLLLNRVKELTSQKNDTKKRLIQAKKDMLDNETRLIEIAIELSNQEELLRVYYATTVKPEITAREKEIASFTERNSEIVAWAKNRDKNEM
jgi:hypothetical protein